MKKHNNLYSCLSSWLRLQFSVQRKKALAKGPKTNSESRYLSMTTLKNTRWVRPFCNSLPRTFIIYRTMLSFKPTFETDYVCWDMWLDSVKRTKNRRQQMKLLQEYETSEGTCPGADDQLSDFHTSARPVQTFFFFFSGSRKAAIALISNR